jgi:aminoglycoside phosphotransferase (APT) family kinase protein
MTDDELREPFGRWLSQRWPHATDLVVDTFESPKSGFSARTIFVPVRYRADGVQREERVVLRLESSETPIYPQQAPGIDVEIELQYRVMEALTEAGIEPLATLIGYESDPSILETPFFAMGHIQGDVATENPPYTSEGFFKDASPEHRRRMIEEGLRILARIHGVDVANTGLTWLSDPTVPPGIRAQIDLWDAFGHRELRDRKLPIFDEGIAWLRANQPAGLRNGFSWGDSRLGNIIYSDATPVCITDFENAAIAPPELDLGWWLMFDRTMHESVEIPRLPGEPTREEQKEIYAGFAGREIGDMHYYEVLGAVRYAAIVVRVINRAVERGFFPEDHVIWRENPAAKALAQLLEAR